MNSTFEENELEGLKKGDEKSLKELYRKYRSPFLKWAQRQYSRYADEIPEVYQQAFTILYFNSKAGKFTGLDSSIQTYLIGIGKNLLNKKIGDKKNQYVSLDSFAEAPPSSDAILEEHEFSHRQILVNSILEKVGEPCKTILVRYYFDNFTMEAIANSLGYKSALMAKKKKWECLIKIRKSLRMKNISINKTEE